MKTKILYLLAAIALFASCTKQDVIKTGVSSPYFDGTIMEYLRSNNYDWEYTVKAIEHAGLTDLFEGKDPAAPQITFWGVTSYSIQRWIWDNKKEEITDFTQEEIKEMLLRHVVVGKYLKADIAYRDPTHLITDPAQTGGTEFTCLGGNNIRAYVDKSDYSGVPEAGPETLYLYSYRVLNYVPLASPDIQPKNGVVHALNYNYKFGNI